MRPRTLPIRPAVKVIDIATPAFVMELSLRCQPATLVGLPITRPGLVGGNVQVSDSAALGGKSFLVLETDDQSGPDAAIKKFYIYRVELGDCATLPAGKMVGIELVRDLRGTGGLVRGKVEAVAVTTWGEGWINTDDDGLVSRAGMQELILLGTLA
jgi:hypothetical protein